MQITKSSFKDFVESIWSYSIIASTMHIVIAKLKMLNVGLRNANIFSSLHVKIGATNTRMMSIQNQISLEYLLNELFKMVVHAHSELDLC